MKKTYIKSFLTVIITFFISMSCDRQLESAPQLTADKLLKDKDFLSFLSSTEEVRYKVIYRQRDLRTFERVDSSLKKIQTWGKDVKLTLKNKALIVNELGFESWSEYEQLENDIQKKRAVIISKYPELLSLPSEERTNLLLKAIERWDNLPQIRKNGGDLCPNCFFNNCDYCSNGQFKEQNPNNGNASGGCEKLLMCKNNAKNKRDAAINQARALFISELVLCGADALAAGGYVAGGSAILGPGSLLAGVITALGVDIGCMALSTYIYANRTREIEADYQHMVWECESMFTC